MYNVDCYCLGEWRWRRVGEQTTRCAYNSADIKMASSSSIAAITQNVLIFPQKERSFFTKLEHIMARSLQQLQTKRQNCVLRTILSVYPTMHNFFMRTCQVSRAFSVQLFCTLVYQSSRILHKNRTNRQQRTGKKAYWQVCSSDVPDYVY